MQTTPSSTRPPAARTAHLRLIVSEPAAPLLVELAAPDRTSIVQPLSPFRFRLYWLQGNAGPLALGTGSALLLAVAAVWLAAR